MAVNSPKKYPSKPLLSSKDESWKNVSTTDAQRMRYARIKYGKNKNGNR